MKPMATKNQNPCDGSDSGGFPPAPQGPLEMLPIYREPAPDNDTPCCGPPAGPASSIHERPGYTLCGFVEGFITTPAGPVPRVKTRLDREDHLGTLRVRIGMGRNDYKVAPGLYAVGDPHPQDPVLVSANYKLSFDHLRKALGGRSAWILVLDTRGINVWCAAGKGTFGTEEIVRRVHMVRLAKVVNHTKLILPQLGAPGVSAQHVRKGCGFEVVWGPVHAMDIPAFLEADRHAETAMRRVTFTLWERLVLVPVELWLIRKVVFWSLVGIFILSGLGTALFSLTQAWQRGIFAAAAAIAGIFGGAVLVPALLPWIPGRSFGLKGIIAGAVMGGALVGFSGALVRLSLWPSVALVLLSVAVSSYLAMNFTGTTPFTSPSGVEKEMRRFIPIQAVAVLAATGIWVASAF